MKTLSPFIVVSSDLPDKLNLKKDHMVSRMALGLSLCKNGFKTEILKTSKGKPLYKKGIYWSLSHKNGVGAGVSSDSPVGIDIEKIREISPKFGYKTAEEKEWRILGGYSLFNFYRNWTAKEAFLKAERSSIFKMKNLSVVNDYGKKIILRNEQGKYYVISFFYTDNIIAAVTMIKPSVIWYKKGF